MDRWEYGTVGVRAFVQGLVAVWCARGVVTAGQIEDVICDACDWHQANPAAAIVCDYRHATVVVPLDDLLRVADGLIQLRSPIAVPMVIVPFPSQLAYFRRYAQGMQARGVGRVVELHYRQAMRWAQEIAQDRLDAGLHQLPDSSAKKSLRIGRAEPDPAASRAERRISIGLQ